MPLSSVRGQERAVEALTKALHTNTVHHAWLFHGLEGVGKELAAVGFAQALTCPKAPGVGCGTCSSCARILKRNHPDVTWVMPEDELVRRGLAARADFDRTPSRDIRIEQVRQLQERLAFHALEAKTKVALLITAHAMNPPAQNALLKTLEEPPRDTVLILVSSAPDKLLPTIRSRCAKAAFRPLPDDVVAERLGALKKVAPEQARRVAKMAQGSLSRALELDADSLDQRRAIIEGFEGLERSDARGWIALAEQWGADRASAELSLEVLQTWLRDVAVAQAGGTGLISDDLLGLAQQAAARVSPISLARRTQYLEEARNAITQRNGAIRLQLERMLIEMMA